MTDSQRAVGSLRVRMLVSAALVLVVFLGVMGLVLDTAFRQSASQAVSERLLLHIYALLAATNEVQAGVIDLPPSLQEPRFNTLGSGLAGFVFDAEGREIWRSRSAIDLILSAQDRARLLSGQTPGEPGFDRLPVSPDHDALFYLSYPVIWQAEAGDARYVYTVIENPDPYQREVNSFRNSLWGWLAAGVLVLVTIQAGIMYWGLLPIGALERDLKAIEQGEQAYLEGQYPSEIAGVTRSLNLLLSGERTQRERYRTTLADLAHSLKTPLAILKIESSRNDQLPKDLSNLMEEQLDRMSDIISYQLERAVVGASSLVKTRVPVVPVADKLVAALQQVYRDKAIEIETDTGDTGFPGDQRDLMELLGNLLDNACKYGQHQVRFTARQDQNQLTLCIEDDGPGIAAADRERVLQRGERLDTRVAGQGIGLAIVVEIVERYHGSIRITESDLGGAGVQVVFPA
ncbi:MAG: ATP-binding protein [Proteobacteria bacterium]|nr:ATP-binding protein [Pseudomonadota bacterium]